MNLFVLFGIFVFEFCAYLDFSSPYFFVTTVCNVFIVRWKYRAQLCIADILCALFYCVLQTCDCVFTVYS